MSKYLWIFILLSFDIAAQTPATKLSGNDISLRQFYKLYPQEKCVLITDNSTYIESERIWFKVFLWNNSQPISDYCHVTLRNEFGIISERNILIRNEEGHGDIKLPDSIASGVYVLEVYTPWTKNFYDKPIASRAVWIGSGKPAARSQYDSIANRILVVPEGGSLQVSVQKNKVAFYTGTLTNRFSVEVIDPLENVVLNKAFEGSFGVAELSVSQPGNYKAKICEDDAARCEYRTLATGKPSLQLVEASASQAVLRVNLADQRDYIVAVVTDQQVLETSKIDSAVPMKFNLSNYPQGVVYFLLCNADGIQSVRPFYHIKEKNSSTVFDESLQIENRQTEFVNAISVVPSRNENVCFFACSSNSFSGAYTFSQLTTTSRAQLNDLLIFKSYPLRKNLHSFFMKSFVPIKSGPRKNQLVSLSSDSLRLSPLDLVLSNLNDRESVSAIIQYKKQIARLKESYNIKSDVLPEKIASEEVYLPGDYPTIGTVSELLEQAIPRLKTKTTRDKKSYHFFYTNLRDEKILHADPPTLLINGYVMHDFSKLEEVPWEDVSSVEVVYNSRALIWEHLLQFFPSGVISIYLKSESPLAHRLADDASAFFSLPYSWPNKMFTHLAENSLTRRFPLFNTLYFWDANLKNASGGMLIPNFVPPYTKLFAFSLTNIKDETYAETIIE